ncbi:Rne/Rng family ribonuclease [Paenibacillus turpanensis]|uniref:Rne/Rng family ribonuclease n=1 Tax=Paenibacillus turpanensis TaxID=2689078 RepID=UPI00140B9AB9|nr:Rne/Rng family ribonuclease [Paenibacillus turpanensis]
MKRIAVHYDNGTTSVALLEEGRLTEFYAERPDSKQLVGNIYKGKVVNILPGMQAAFIDIGLEKNAFLYVDDLLPAHLEKQPKTKPDISELVTLEQELVVQLMKEPLGTKGARVTTHFALPGRWLVYMPEADYVGISRKIESETERVRLKKCGDAVRQPGEGLILRTVAEGESEEALHADISFLRDLWGQIVRKAEKEKPPSLLYRDLDLVPRLMRDVFSERIDEMVLDNRQQAEEARVFLRDMAPELADRIKTYTEKVPLFEQFGVTAELDRVLKRRLWLKSGGYLVLDQTEALTVIDVNTGKYTGSDNLDDTVLRTNLEAAEEAARLLRLKDIGGIIIIDFIDMRYEEHRQSVVERLEQKLKLDRTKAMVVGWTGLGLLEVTRKKVREHMDHLFFEPCRACSGTGKVQVRR